MITLSTIAYPPESAKEIGKRFLKMSPTPDYIDVSGPYTVPTVEGGLRAITIYRYDRTRAGEANEAIASLHMALYGIPGYTYSLQLAAGARMSMKMLGLA